MALMAWNSNLSVKIKQFDDQHKKLVDMVNELHDAMKEGKGNVVLGKILNGLISYTASHFSEEERLMSQHSFPGFALHKVEHDKLVKQVLELQGKFNGGKAALTSEVMNFLKDWLVRHIQGDDKKYGEYLSARGVA